METLYLHEGAPGHHFQISLAQENESLPNFQRFGGTTAFVKAGDCMRKRSGRNSVSTPIPYQYFGYLDSQLFRAIRLVVDTGIHSKGWTRDQTIRYITENSSRGLSNATAETERYIAIPARRSPTRSASSRYASSRPCRKTLGRASTSGIPRAGV
jgi:uncharacterized protein (DUF885 family)